MHRRHLAIGLVALLMTIGLTGVPRAARAASSVSDASATPATPATLRETTKIVLPETSIDGPAFWTNIPTGAPGAGANDIIAWTGTDSMHHLNTLTVRGNGSGGWTFGNKETLHETSFAHPAVTVQPSQEHATYYFVAWTGTNTAHSLNVICDGCAASRIKLTLWNESSIAAPAVAMLGGKLMLAWTGTDANHSLNVLDIGISNGRFVVGHKTTLTLFSSATGPGLAYEPNKDVGDGLILSWVATADKRLHYALSPDGRTWPRCCYGPINEWSGATPNVLAMVPFISMPHHYLAWTGLDQAHLVNVQYTNTFPGWPPQTKVTLRESALGGPELGCMNGVDLAQILLVWTGTDSQHHLNFATINV